MKACIIYADWRNATWRNECGPADPAQTRTRFRTAGNPISASSAHEFNPPICPYELCEHHRRRVIGAPSRRLSAPVFG
jgi:hypothetical protein